MNKKFTAFFSGYGMSVNGNYAYGVVEGYETNASVSNFDSVSPLKIHVSFYATDEQKRGMEAAIRNLSRKFLRTWFTPYGLSIGINGFTVNSILKKLPDILKSIYGIISGNGALNKDYCPVCGKPLDISDSKKSNIEGFTITIDNDCVTAINNAISAENLDFNNAPNNYLLGFLGACIGGLAGAACSVVLFFVGFVSSISAIISVVLGAYLYRKFHGKPNKVMIIIVALTTLVFMVASILILYIMAAYGLALKVMEQEGIQAITAMEAFRIYMKDPEFSREFYSNLAMVLLFSAIGIGYEVYALSRKIKRKKNI